MIRALEYLGIILGGSGCIIGLDEWWARSSRRKNRRLK